MAEEVKKLIHVVDRRDTDAVLAAAYGNKYLAQTCPDLADDVYFTSSGLHVQRLNEARDALKRPRKVDPTRLKEIAELVFDYAVIADLRGHPTRVETEKPNVINIKNFLKYLGGDEEKRKLHKTMKSEGLTHYEEKVGGVSKIDHPQQTTRKIHAPFDESSKMQSLELVLVMNPKDVRTVKDIEIPGLPARRVKGLEDYAGVREKTIFDSIVAKDRLYVAILNGIKSAVEKSVDRYLADN